MALTTRFQRGVFFSWYCSTGDCKFCYMSTQKEKIKEPKAAVRSRESILAEALICRELGWGIEFLSGGHGAFGLNNLVELCREIYEITGQKQWLNIGVIGKPLLEKFKPYIDGVSGTIESINTDVREFVCPSKPIEPILKMFKTCDELGIKKSITIIIGLGETEDDISTLIDFIKEYSIDRITLYALNPVEGTIFKEGPSTEYYIKWIKAVRENYLSLEIIAGSHIKRKDEIHKLLKAGATDLTKFPSIKRFNSDEAKEFENEVKLANRKFLGSLTKVPDIDWDKKVEGLNLDPDMKQKVMKKLHSYLETMRMKKE